MDKIAANNHFVVLRKEIKKAKAMVAGKLIRKIKEQKKESEGVEDEVKSGKIRNKIDAIYEEIRLLKTLDSYPIAKQATMKPGKEHWDKLASHSKASPEERLSALVICKNNVQKQVSKFRDDHKDCDEWLEEYIEYREKKNELVNPSKRHKKGTRNGPKKAVVTQESARPQKQNKSKGAPKPIHKGQGEKSQSKNGMSASKDITAQNDKEILHPSWESKRKEKELLKAALSGQAGRPKKVIFD